ncbi:MAG: class I SAM-dependent methyltransferase [Halioglobus sp.]
MIEQRLGGSIANISFALMRGYVHSAQRRGVAMMHTARPFSYYRKVFYQGQSRSEVLHKLTDKRIVDVGCGYTPYAEDSMFRACHDAHIEFYGVDPLIGTEIKFGLRERALVRATGGRGNLNPEAPGLSRAIGTTAQELPFDDQSVDEILCSYLMFVWIEDEGILADILEEFLRVLKTGGQVKLYPLHEWRVMRFKNRRLLKVLAKFKIQQDFTHGGHDLRVMPSLLTRMTKK